MTKNQNLRIQKIMDQLHNQALQYLEQGYSVIPVSGKKPLISSWVEFQNRKPTQEEIATWFSELNPTGIAIVTGKISGIVVVDVDLGGSTENLPETLSATSGTGGRHFYYKHPGFPVKSSAGQVGFKIDIRGDGGFIVAPPSMHENGSLYVWDKGFADIKIAEFPKQLLEEPKIKGNISEIVLGVEEGRRNQSSATIIGKLLHHLPKKDWAEFGWPLIQGWNSNNKPPIEVRELKSTFSSIANSELSKRNPQITFNLVSTADLLAKEIKEPEWIVKDLIPLNGITALSGPPGQGKTWITLAIAISIARGEPLFNEFPVKKGAVLIVDEENNENMTAGRIRLLKADKEDHIHWLIQKQFKLGNEDHLKTVKQLAENNNVSLIIFDSLVRIHDAQENDAREMAQTSSYLRKLMGKEHTILFTHHHRKERIFDPNQIGNSMRGSSDILASVDAHIAIQMKSTDEEHTREITVYVSKQRQAEEIGPFKLKMTSIDDQVAFEYAGKEDIQKTKLERTKLIVMEILNTELATQEIIDRVSQVDTIGKTMVSRALKSLEQDKLIKKEVGSAGKHTYQKINPEIVTEST